MKKLVALILITLLCLCSVACGDNGIENTEIVGEWFSLAGINYTFLDDGTGELCIKGSTSDFTWKYDKDLSTYVIASSVGNLNASVKTDGDLQYLQCGGTKFYTKEIFQQKLPALLEEAEQKFAKDVSEFTKIELGKEYIADNISVRFDLRMENGVLWLCSEITNKGSQTITLENYGSDYCPVYTGFRIEYFAGEWSKSIGGFGLTVVFDGEIQSIAPGQTGVIKTQIAKKGQWIKDQFGTIIGYISCSVGTEVENKYISFADKFGK